LDRYFAGEDVSFAEVRKVWRKALSGVAYEIFWCASISTGFSLTTVENPTYPALAPEFLPANPISRGREHHAH
jgi:hypothetical protein